MKKLNTKGFGAIEIVAIIVVLAILGFVGYRAYSVYTEESNADQELATKRDNEEKDEEKLEDDADYLEVAQWGVKIPPPKDVKISYLLKESGKFAEFQTEELKKFDVDGCMNYIYVARGTADQQAAVSDGPTDGNYTFEQAYSDYPEQYGDDSLAIKIGDYYYIEFVGGGGSCAKNASDTISQDAVDEQKNVLREALKQTKPL